MVVEEAAGFSTKKKRQKEAAQAQLMYRPNANYYLEENPNLNSSL